MKIRYILLIIVLILSFGFSTQANTIVPTIMLLLSGNNEQELNVTATFDEINLDLATLE